MTREVMSLRIPKELKDELQNIAVKKGFSLNSLILKILWEYMDKGNDNEKSDKNAT